MAYLTAHCSFMTVRHICRPLMSFFLLRLGQHTLPMLCSLIVRSRMSRPLALEHQARELWLQ